MVGTNSSTNENHKFCNSTVQVIPIVGGDCATKSGSLCTHFFYMGAPVNTQVVNGLSRLFVFRGQTIDKYEQAVFTLKYLGLRDYEGNKINISAPLTSAQRLSVSFVSFMMKIHL